MAENKTKNGMVSRQSLYVAVLVSLVLGFISGAVYTSFKLAKDGHQAASGGSPHATAMTGGEQPQMDAEAGAKILELETRLQQHPDDADAWIALGNIFFDTHRFSDAIDAYEKSLALVPGNPGVLTDLGVMYRRSNEPQKAVEAFDRAVTAHPDFETAWFNKGVVLMHDLNDLSGALKAWEGLVAINPLAKAPDGRLVKDLVEGLKNEGLKNQEKK